MAMLEVSEQLWLHPTGRLTWEETRTAARAASGVRSGVVLDDATLDECIDRAVQQCWPKCFQHIIVRCEAIEEAPDGVILPWQPYVVFDAFWRDEAEDAANGGYYIPSAYWMVENDQWRWMAEDSAWLPHDQVQWQLHMLGKPQPRTVSETYCTVALHQLLPMVNVEVAFQLAMQRTQVNVQQTFQLYQNQREQARQNMTRMRWPAHFTKFHYPTMNTVITDNWGQDNVTFADVR
jgi:hypothetical protein